MTSFYKPFLRVIGDEDLTLERNHRKNEEAGLFLYVTVCPLGLSDEQVAQYKKLFLTAIHWYTREQADTDKKTESYLQDREYSHLVGLKEIVEKGKELPSGQLITLLESILNDYLPHLRKLKEKPWIKQEAIEEQINQLKELSRDNDLRIKTQ